MTVIRIQERSEQAGIFQATVSFNQGPEYAITVRDPFSKEEEERLEWYFEKHLEFPFTDQIKAQEAAISIITYGESLFTQVFASEPHILAAYNAAAKVGLATLQIEIVGRPSFHALHWEALKDPELPDPLALQSAITRKNAVLQVISTTAHPSPTINLLIVIARPRGRSDVGYRTISRPLVEALGLADVPVQVDILRPGTYQALENHLRDITNKRGTGYYQVIHFDVHGSLLTYDFIPSWLRHKRSGRQDILLFKGLKAFLEMEGQWENTGDLVEAEELAALLIKHQIPIAILNACQSGKQAGASETSLASHLIQGGVQLVLAMGYSVTVTAAVLLMKTLYQQLFNGNEFSTAIRTVRSELYYCKERRAYFDQYIDLEDWLLPVIYQNHLVQFQHREFTLEERSAYNKRKLDEQQYAPPKPQYGFVGRDLDILQIEKCLLTKRNLLLIRGMGGVGKSTLLKHLRAWWHMTGFVQQTFYFGYDERAWTREQILTTLAQHLLNSDEYIGEFIPLDLDLIRKPVVQ